MRTLCRMKYPLGLAFELRHQSKLDNTEGYKKRFESYLQQRLKVCYFQIFGSSLRVTLVPEDHGSIPRPRW